MKYNIIKEVLSSIVHSDQRKIIDDFKVEYFVFCLPQVSL